MRRTSCLITILCATWCVALPASTQAAGMAQERGVDPLIERTEDPLELQQLAIQFIRANQPTSAVVALRKALLEVPDNGETHMWLGVALAQIDELEAAKEELDQALELNPALTEAHNWLGIYWYRKGEPERAIEEYRTALEDPAYPRVSRARVLVNLGRLLLEEGDVEAAIPTLSEATRAPLPSDDQVFVLSRLLLGEALIKNGRPDEALGTLERLLEGPRPAARALLLAGMAHRDLGELERAEDRLRQVLRQAPGTEDAERALEILRQIEPSSGGRQ